MSMSVASSSYGRKATSSCTRPKGLPARRAAIRTRHVAVPSANDIGSFGAEHEHVALAVVRKRGYEPVMQSLRIAGRAPQPDVDVLGEPGAVAETDLQCHPTLEHPRGRLGRLESGEDPFDHHPSAKAVEADPAAP